MSGTDGVPWPERWLLGLIRGADAEFVVGDVLERYVDDLRSGMPRARARGRLTRQVLATVVRWWTSAARVGGGTPGHERGPSAMHSNRGGGMGELARDLTYSARSLLRRPGLALGVVVTLALGVGATTAIYSVVDGILLRPLDYEDADRLVAVGTTFPGREWRDEGAGLQALAGSSYLNYVEFRGRARTLSALGAAEQTSVLMSDEGAGPELVRAVRVTPEFWSALGVTAAGGRLFTTEEYTGGDAAPIVLAHGAWVRLFGADLGAVGRTLDRARSGPVVVGVLPEGFTPPEAFGPPPEIYMPLTPDHPRYADRGMRSVYMVGTLVPGATVDAARVELDAIADQLAVEFPDGNVYPDGRHFGAGANGLLAETVGTTGDVLLVFLGAASLLFLIAVLNATTLLLARSLERVREMGVRVALGAAASRIVRLLLVESLMLAALGGVLGALLGYAGVRAFHAFGPSSLPRMSDVVVDERILAFTLALSVVTGLAAGLVPALRHVRRAPWRGLAGRPGVQDAGRLRGALVTVQVAVAVLLLAAAGVLFRSFLELRAVDPGFEPQGRIALSVPLKRPDAPVDEASWQAWDLLLGEIRATPGVLAVAGTSNTPFEDPDWGPRVLLPGETEETWREGVAGYVVTPGYLDAVGTRLLRGRPLAASDGPDDPPVALVNEAFVRDVVGPGVDPIGLGLRLGGGEGSPTVVGVVEDVVQRRAEDGPRPALYVPYTQGEWPWAQVVVRTDLPADDIVPELRRSVARFSGAIPPQRVRTLEWQVVSSRTDQRFQALLFGAFAGVALLLAAAGLYAALAHAVGRRRRELGIRMALGAERARVRAMVLAQGARVVGVGLAIGLAGALAVNRVLAHLLFQVRPGDPPALAGAATVLGVVALVAAYLPARQATAVDPVDVLKSE